jgi:hypothetical protein
MRVASSLVCAAASCASCAAVDQRAGVPHHQPAGLQLAGGFGQAPAPALVVGQRSTEAVALFAMGRGHPQRFAHHAAAHGRDVGAGTVDRAQRGLEGLARRVHQFVVLRQVALQPEPAGADAVLAAQRKGRFAR